MSKRFTENSASAAALANLLLRLEVETKATLERDKLDDHDRLDIEALLEEIEPTFNALASQVFEPLRDQGRERYDEAYILFHRFAAVLLRIGAHAVRTNSTRYADDRERTIKPRTVRQNKTTAFDAAVKAEADALKREPAVSKKFWKDVAPGVQKQFNLKKPPSESRIKDAVRRLRAQRRGVKLTQPP